MRIHTLDLIFQNTPGLIAAYLVECDGGELALIETGPASTKDTLLAAIRARGFDPARIGNVFVTHIHLDHAGAAGWWARQGARVHCHSNAARHLVDPSRLIESARMIYGSAMDTLWGEIVPAPADQVRILQDGESVAIGTTKITAWDTPGHARHHHAYVMENVCFTGDVAGVRLEGSAYISVAAAPPQFDPAEYVRSVDRLLAGGFGKLALTHFGIITDPSAHLAAYRERIQAVSEFARASWNAGEEDETFRERFCESEHRLAQESDVSASLWAKYELANSTSMCADGIRLFAKKAQ